MLPFNADNSYCGHVLIVDDVDVNRMLLRDPLEMQGHTITEASHGQEAIELAVRVLPDVILLDLMMPGMDGYAVCRALKQDPQTAHIPVIIVTSLHERAERLRGMDAGANDFLTKPLDITDVILRVRNAVYSKSLSDRYRNNYHALQKVEAFRDNLIHMVIHDMRQPLMLFQGNLDLLMRSASGKLDENEKRYTRDASRASDHLAGMISSLLDVHALEEHSFALNLAETDPVALIQRTVDKARIIRPEVEVVLTTEPTAALLVTIDSDLIERVLGNLLSNAIKFSPPGKRVEVSFASTLGDNLRVSVHDDGPGIPQADRVRIFDKFFQSAGGRRQNSSGLGLTFCKLAIEAHGGRIGVGENPPAGTEMWFTIPLTKV